MSAPPDLGTAAGTPEAEAQIEAPVGEGFSVTNFAENFEVLAEAPGGLTKLRRLVVMLGLTGRLSGGRHGWQHRRLSDCVDVLDSRRMPVNESERARRIAGKRKDELFPYFGATRQQGWIDAFLFDEDLVLLGEDGVPFLDPDRPKAYVVQGKTWVNNHAHVLRPRAMDPTFLCHALNYTDYQGRITGTTRAKLTQRKMLDIPIAAPPLAEQKRIVAKVDQLMALCVELEGRQTKKREIGARLTESALTAVRIAEEREAFGIAWRRIVENFDLLFGSSAAVASLRDTIAQLAFRGALVKQLRGDRPAAAVREEVRAAWVGKKRKEVLPEVDVSERPASPARWEWVRLGNLAEVVGGPAKGRDLKGRSSRAYPYLRVANVQRGYLDLEVMKEMEIAQDEIEKYRVLPGDVLFTEGGDWDKLGRSAVWSGEIEDCIHQNHIFRARLVTTAIEPLWCSTYANSPAGRRYFEDAAKQTTNLASINMTQLRNCPMPLPPAGEQGAVLVKLRELTSLCDELEARLARAEERAGALAAAAAHQVLM